jgi:hypothetical protein
LMVVEMRRRILADQNQPDSTVGTNLEYDWHGDVARNQVPLALYGLGLALIRMS